MTQEERKALKIAIETGSSVSAVLGVPPRLREPETFPAPVEVRSKRQECTACGKPKSSAYFRVHKKFGKKYQDSRCDDCRRIACICRNMAITPDYYRQLVSEARGQCSICQRAFTATMRPMLDHCHETGKLRSPVCVSCNSGLGHFRDDIDTLLAAAEYIRSWKASHSISESNESDIRRKENMSKIRENSKKPRK